MPILSFFIAVFILEITPGPNMAYLATLALSWGRMAGVKAAAGVALGLTVHAIIAALGVGVMIQKSPLLYETLRWCGVAYLLYLAWDGWRGEKGDGNGVEHVEPTGWVLFRRGFITNVLNPKSIVFFVSVVPQFVTPGYSLNVTVQMAIFGLIYVGVATSVHLTIVVLAGTLRPWLVEGQRQAVVRKVLSVMLAGIALWLAWSTGR